MRTSRFDLSLAGRLAIGFGVLLSILLMLTVVVFRAHIRSSDAQSSFVEVIAPRTELTRALQAEVLSLGIALRSYLLVPEPGRLQRYRESRDSTRDAARRLTAAPAATLQTGEVAFEPVLDRYMQLTDRLVSDAAGNLTAAQELELADAREAAVAALRTLATLDAAETTEALSSLSEARAKVRQVLVAATGVMIVCFLGLAFATTRSIVHPVRTLVQVAAALEAGDWRPALALAPTDPSARRRQPRDEMLVVGRAFGAAAIALERRAQRLRADSEVASAAASTLDKQVLAGRALGAMTAHVGAEIGVLYARAGRSEALEPIAQHAPGAIVAPVRVGEGIPGQALKDRRTIVVRDIPPDSPFVVRLGYDRAPAKTVAAVPLPFKDDVLGVLVIGSLRDIDADALAFLEAAGSQLGIALQNAAAHEEIERLLADLRESNQQLQAQSEELQAQNEEIQAQNEEIQTQNEELQAQAEELHAQNGEIQRRTRELEEQGAELRRHAALLAEADERKNDFLGLLAHELRNPLSPMTVSLYILKQTPPGSERALRAQEVIERQVQHLSRLTDDLLDVTRISHGKIQIDREPLNLVEVIRHCLEDQQAANSAKKLAIDISLPELPVWVDGDRTRLCQVFNNLLSNASKFTREGGHIGVRVRAAGGEAALEIEDDGSGIDPALLPRIFQPFTQGTTSLARTNGGLGLGLALVKALVQLHDGSVHAHSDGPDCGSRFTVRLPVRSAPAVPVDTLAISPLARTWRVLIVEDNRDAAASLKEALELQGHQVDVARTGPEGLEKARLFVPDVVLCDIGLPTMDGYEVARHLRSDERLRSTMLVAVSGYAAEQDKIRAAAAGFDRHLAKPLTMEQLTALLAQLQLARSGPTW